MYGLLYRDAPRVKNPEGLVVMRRLLICQNPGGAAAPPASHLVHACYMYFRSYTMKPKSFWIQIWWYQTFLIMQCNNKIGLINISFVASWCCFVSVLAVGCLTLAEPANRAETEQRQDAKTFFDFFKFLLTFSPFLQSPYKFKSIFALWLLDIKNWSENGFLGWICTRILQMCLWIHKYMLWKGKVV